MTDGASRFEALRKGNSWEFMFTNSPKCPHCGHDCSVLDNEWWFLYEEGEHDVECPSCDKEFSVSTHVSHSFSTDHLPDEIDCDGPDSSSINQQAKEDRL